MNEVIMKVLTKILGISILLNFVLITNCGSIDTRIEAANLQPIELNGKISVVTQNGTKTPQLTTNDGKTYTITGKLDRMIRDFYRGQVLRLSGHIEAEPSGNEPGIFKVEEIILEID